MEISSAKLAQFFQNCEDFESRKIYIGGNPHREVTLCYIDGLVNSTRLGEGIIRALSVMELSPKDTDRTIFDRLLHGGTYVATVEEVASLTELATHLTEEKCALVFDSLERAITFEIKSSEHRSITEPHNEKTVKGAKDAFVENIRINTMLVRRKLRTPNLKIERQLCGARSKTVVDVMYIAGLTNRELVRSVINRISKINIDGMITSGNLEEYIVDCPKTPFPQLMSTERSDKFAINLLEGRVGILVDGIPIGFLIPGTFGQFFKVPEDNSNHYLVSSALTIIRYVALAISLFLPALYVAISMYQQQMIPTQLMITIIESKENVPIATALEVMGMMIAFELLQESGLRLPNPIGETIGIIGALIVGESAVSANVMSPIVVIVVALAGIAGYTMPNQDFAYAVRIARFLLVICALMGGMFGVGVGTAVLIYHLCSLESFGVAYMTPFCNGTSSQVGDALFRKPLARSKWREEFLKPRDRRNQE